MPVPASASRVYTVLAFGAAFAVITFVLFETGRRAPSLLLPVVGPVGGLAIMALGSVISGSLFFSSPALWLGLWVGTTTRAHPASLIRDPLWLIAVPFFIYGSIHGLFITTGLTWAQMARTFARRYIATVLGVGAVGLVLAMVTMARTS